MTTVHKLAMPARSAPVVRRRSQEVDKIVAQLAQFLPRATPVSAGRLQALLLLACAARPSLEEQVTWRWAPWLPVPDELVAKLLVSEAQRAKAVLSRRRHAVGREARQVANLARGPGALRLEELAALARDSFAARASAERSNA